MSRPYDVTVVVACLNAASTLQRCIDSVTAQQGLAIQLVVADGGSTDGTVAILGDNDRVIDDWQSGPDNGVYGAWNKALAKAAGDWVCFLGADDAFAGDAVLQRLVEAGRRVESDLVCSRVRYPDGKLVGQPWEWSKMVRFMCVAHPGMLHRRTLFERYGNFSEHYRIAGDYEFLLRLGPQVKAAFVDEATVEVGGSGLSSDTLASLKEMRLVQARHPSVGPVRAAANYGYCLFERGIWAALDRVPFPVPQHAGLRAVGGLLGLHRHDYDPELPTGGKKGD